VLGQAIALLQQRITVAKTALKKKAEAEAKKQKKAESAVASAWSAFLGGSSAPVVIDLGEEEEEPEDEDDTTAKKSRKKKKKPKKRDSLDSTGSRASLDGEGDDDAGSEQSLNGVRQWGLNAVKLSRFERMLRGFVKPQDTRPAPMVFGAAGGQVGLLFIEYVTCSGERSLTSWLDNQFEEVMVAKHGSAYRTRPPREVFELRYRVYELERLLRNATFVDATLCGSSTAIDDQGRRLFSLYQVLAADMPWHIAERFLPAGAVKRAPGVPTARLVDFTRMLKKEEKAKATLRGEEAPKTKSE
jgi:hypothetical protein